MLWVLLVLALLAPEPADARAGAKCREQMLDYGGRVTVNPYEDTSAAAGCQPRITFDQQLFSKLNVEEGEVWDTFSPREPGGDACTGPHTLGAYRIRRSKVAAAATAKDLHVPPMVYGLPLGEARLSDLIPAVRAGTFDFSCLVLAEDGFDEVLGELQANSPSYGWNWAHENGSYSTSPAICDDGLGGKVKCEIRDLLVAACAQAQGEDCENAYKRPVYRLGQSVGAGRTFWPEAVLLDLSKAGCRSMQADVVSHRVLDGAFDAVAINGRSEPLRWTSNFSKPPTVALSAWKSESALQGAGTPAADWLGQQLDPDGDGALSALVWSSVPSGAARHFQDLTSPWAANSAGGSYTYSARLAGLQVLHDLIRARGIRTLFWTSDEQIRWNGAWNDPNTVANEETAFLQPIANAASYVAVQKGAVTPAQRAAGYALYPRRVTPFDVAAGRRGRIPDDCSPPGFSNAATAFLIPRILIANPGGTPELRVGEDGSTTGNWTGKVWCDQPAVDAETAPTGDPDATISSTADGTAVDLTDCASAWENPGTYRVALEVTQDGETEYTWSDIERRAVPAVAGVDLVDCATDQTLASLTSSEAFSVSLSEIGNPSCLAFHVRPGANAASMAFDYTPAPGESATLPYPGDTEIPYCWPWDEGGTVATPNCEPCPANGDLRHIGLHQLVVTPCNVDADYLGGDDCADAGGIAGTPFTALVEIEPEPTTNTLVLLVEPGGQHFPTFTPDSLKADIGGDTPGTGTLSVCCDATSCTPPGDLSLVLGNGEHELPTNICDSYWDEAGEFTLSGRFVRSPGAPANTSVPIVVLPSTSTTLYQQDFDTTAIGQDPASWCDHNDTWNGTCTGNVYSVQDFSGSRVYQASNTADSFAHYNGPGSSAWTNYTARARIRSTTTNGGVGIGIFSQLNAGGEGKTYRFRTYAGASWVLYGRGVGASCVNVFSNFAPANGTDVWVKMRGRDLGTATQIDAVVWRAGTAEPEFGACTGGGNNGCASCTDSSANRSTGGTVGFWQNAGPAPGTIQRFDNLLVQTGDPEVPATNTVSLSITPLGTQTAPFTPSSITAEVGGTQAGTGTLRFCCDATSSCTSPDYQASGVGNGVHNIPTNACASAYATAGSKTARVEFARSPAPTAVDTEPVVITSEEPPPVGSFPANDPQNWGYRHPSCPAASIIESTPCPSGTIAPGSTVQNCSRVGGFTFGGNNITLNCVKWDSTSDRPAACTGECRNIVISKTTMTGTGTSTPVCCDFIKLSTSYGASNARHTMKIEKSVLQNNRNSVLLGGGKVLKDSATIEPGFAFVARENIFRSPVWGIDAHAEHIAFVESVDGVLLENNVFDCQNSHNGGNACNTAHFLMQPSNGANIRGITVRGNHFIGDTGTPNGYEFTIDTNPSNPGSPVCAYNLQFVNNVIEHFTTVGMFNYGSCPRIEDRPGSSCSGNTSNGIPMNGCPAAFP